MLYVKLLCVLFPAICVGAPDTIPTRCKPYVSYFTNSSNPSRELAQTEQESGCNPFAESPYAKGLRQFTDRTGEWMSLTHCKHLGDYDPFDEQWSIECGLVYMELLENNNDYGGYCINRQIAEMEYNGGAWVLWELQHVGRTSLVDSRKVCGTRLYNGRKRANWACKENYDYPHHISRRQVNYLSLGGQQCK